jgi:hypothetical protein
MIMYILLEKGAIGPAQSRNEDGRDQAIRPDGVLSLRFDVS